MGVSSASVGRVFRLSALPSIYFVVAKTVGIAKYLEESESNAVIKLSRPVEAVTMESFSGDPR